MNEEQLYDKIDAYLKGELPPEEEAAFEREVANDPALAREVELARQEQAALRIMLEDELAEQLKSWDWEKAGSYNPLPGNGPDNKKDSGRWWPWLLILLALLLAGLLFFLSSREAGLGNRQGTQEGTPAEPAVPGPKEEPAFQEEKPIPQDQEGGKGSSPVAGHSTDGPSPGKDFIALAETLYSPTTFATSRREADAQAENIDTLGTAMAAYNRKELQRTIRLLEQVGKEDPSYFTSQLVLGRAYFESGAFEKAGLAFQRVMDSSYEQLADEARWLCVLSYLAAGRGESEAFRQLLERIIDESNQHPQREKAIRLKEEWLK